MSWTQASIVNCRSASIRRAPWIPLYDKELVGIRDGPKEVEAIVKTGDRIEVDVAQICYDWTDRKFYKVRNPEGWIYEGCIDLVGENDG